jgi:signal transduction histidine kinase
MKKGECDELFMQDKNKIPINRAKRIKDINQILKNIDALFTDGDDYTEKLTDMAHLFIPVMADWCCIHLFNPSGTLERVTLTPSNLITAQAVYDWVQNDLPNDEAEGIPAVLLSGRPVITTQLNPVRRGAEAGIKSYMIIPLAIQQQILGTITLICADSGRHYDKQTSDFAENLAIHVKTSLEKFQLQNQNQRLIVQGEQHAGAGSNELQGTLTQLKQSEDMIQTLFRFSNKLNATLDVELILDTLAQEAIQIVNGESGFAGLRMAEGMTVQKYFQEGAAIPFEHTWVLGEGIPGWVLKYKVPYGTSDAENDPHMSHELAINTNVHSIICTPILDTVGEVIAFFDIRNKKGEEGFTINDQEMLLTMAPVASIAIQNALAYQQRLVTVNELRESSKQLQQLAVSLENAREEERLQVSRELHDELGQALTAVKFDLAWLSDQLEQKDETLAQKTKDIASQMNALIKSVRRIATELRPGMLDDLGLAASIEWQARDFEKRSGVTCALHLPDDELNLTQDQSLAIFRIFQEALTNINNYAGAEMVKVTLEKTGDRLTLEINDDGRGIKETEISSSHSLGLIGMRERAKYLGGTFEVKGNPDQGTTLRITIPVTQQL